MRKLSKIWTAILCVILMFVCVVPASAGKQAQTKVKSMDVMLVVDDTVSMQRNDPNHIASLALQKFVERIPGEGGRIGMATYDDDILTSTSSLTGTDRAMIRVISNDEREDLKEFAETGLTQDGRFTDLPNALYYAVQQIKSLPPMDSAPVIIAVSDGENDFINKAAETRSDKMLEEVLHADIPVYLIVINASGRSDVKDYMQGIADGTSGKALFVNSGDEIDTFLVDIVNEILQPVISDETIAIDIGLEPVDWEFSLPIGVFEATVELTHEQELDMNLFGPDGTQIPLEGNQNVALSSIQNREGLMTVVRLMEPEEGDYILRFSSPLGKQPVVGQIILYNEIYVQVELSSVSVSPGDGVEVTARLMRGGMPYTDLEFANLNASVAIDEDQPEEMGRDESEGVFRYRLTAPSQKGEHQVVVTVQGQKSFLRSSDPVTLTVQNPPKPGIFSGSSSGGGLPDSPSVPIWLIILVAALLIVIILIVVILLRRIGDSGRPAGQYIRLQGTLTVRYFDSMHQHIWEKYVRPGTNYTKRSPRESLGKLLRDQQQDYGDIPEYFDKIQIAGLQFGDGKLCVEVTGELDTPSGPEKINRRIDIANGMFMDDMDSMDSMGFYDTVIVFPDGTQTEMEFSL